MNLMPDTTREVKPAQEPTQQASKAADAAMIRRLTCFDVLTGLPNGLLFREHLSLMLRTSRRKGTMMAVMLADIDDFRRIKNSLGQAQGDSFIQAVSARLKATLNQGNALGDTAREPHSFSLARLNANEFAILLGDLHKPHDAQRMARALREALSAGLTIGGHEIFPTLSLGVALFPGDGEDVDNLIAHADIALGQAKDRGKDRAQFYDSGMNALAVDRLALEGQLRRAVEAQEFFPVYQPRIDVRTGRLSSIEALVRWRHPQRGVLAPAAFIEAAERSRLIVPMGEFMLHAACEQNLAWQRMGLPPVSISVNVSAAQVARSDFVRTVARALERTGLAPQWLELEITETLLVNDAAGALRTFSAVKALGVRTAIDDFGTGFSSLSYLRDFPFDVLKIDRAFVSGLPGQTRTCGVTCAIIDLSRRLGLDVVAEGVETREQRNFLAANGCHLMQGYLYSKPVPPAELERFWRAGIAAPGVLDPRT